MIYLFHLHPKSRTAKGEGVKGVGVVVVVMLLVPIIFAAIYGWPVGAKNLWDRLRRRQGKEAVELSRGQLVAAALVLGFVTYGLGYLLFVGVNETVGIVVILLGMPGWMVGIFGVIDLTLRWLGSKGSGRS